MLRILSSWGSPRKRRRRAGPHSGCSRRLRPSEPAAPRGFPPPGRSRAPRLPPPAAALRQALPLGGPGLQETLTRGFPGARAAACGWRQDRDPRLPQRARDLGPEGSRSDAAGGRRRPHASTATPSGPPAPVTWPSRFRVSLGRETLLFEGPGAASGGRRERKEAGALRSGEASGFPDAEGRRTPTCWPREASALASAVRCCSHAGGMAAMAPGAPSGKMDLKVPEPYSTLPQESRVRSQKVRHPCGPRCALQRALCPLPSWGGDSGGGSDAPGQPQGGGSSYSPDRTHWPSWASPRQQQAGRVNPSRHRGTRSAQSLPRPRGGFGAELGRGAGRGARVRPQLRPSCRPLQAPCPAFPRPRPRPPWLRRPLHGAGRPALLPPRSLPCAGVPAPRHRARASPSCTPRLALAPAPPPPVISCPSPSPTSLQAPGQDIPLAQSDTNLGVLRLSVFKP